MHDVLVVGAGPAGSRVARDLASAGFDVVIVEEHRAVGSPCHCSGLVTPRTLDVAAVGRDIVLNDIRGAYVRGYGGNRYGLGGNRIYGSVIDRSELDRRLATQATYAGAELRLTTRYEDHRVVTSGPAGRRHVDVKVTSGGAPHVIRARLLVGCDGARSRVARRLRGRGHALTGMISGLGALGTYGAHQQRDHVEVFLDQVAAPDWFGWTIPLRDGTARLGTGSGNGVRPIDSFRLLQERFPDSFGASEIISRKGGLIALWEPGPIVGDRVMLVGDAARQVKPTSGGGIYQALFAAGLAAGAAATALSLDDLSAASLREYEQSWKRAMQPELLRQQDLRRAFMALSRRDIASFLTVLDRPGIRAALADTGDIDFPSTAAVALLRHEPLLALRVGLAMRSPLAWLDAVRSPRHQG